MLSSIFLVFCTLALFSLSAAEECWGDADCLGPFELYPVCEQKLDWNMLYRDSAYFARKGLDGSRCSMQKILARSKGGEVYCPDPCAPAPPPPPIDETTVAEECWGDADCLGPYELYPMCEEKLDWNMLNRDSAFFAKRGLDGSRCSMQKLLARSKDGEVYCPDPCAPAPPPRPIDETTTTTCVTEVVQIIRERLFARLVGLLPNAPTSYSMSEIPALPACAAAVQAIGVVSALIVEMIGSLPGVRPGTLIPSSAVDFSSIVIQSDSRQIGEQTSTKNQYAWGMDYSKECDLSVTIHSPGTPAYIAELFGEVGDYNPTVTIRDSQNKVVLQQPYPLKVVGVRSVLVIGCDETSVRFLSGTVKGLPGTGLELVYIHVDLETTILTVENSYGLPSYTSIRSLAKFGDTSIIFVPIRDDSRAGLIQPKLITAQVVENTVVDFVEWVVPGYENVTAQVWTFELVEANGQTPAFLMVNVVAGPTYDANSSLLRCAFPMISFYRNESYYYEDRNESYYYEVDTDLQCSEMPSPFTIAHSALALESLSTATQPGVVIVGTLSGFAYKSVALASSGVLGGSGVSSVLSGGLAAIELGQQQQMAACDVYSLQCKLLTIPKPSPGNAYIWSIKECGGWIFAGTLDVSLQIANGFLAALSQSMEEPLPPQLFQPPTTIGEIVIQSTVKSAAATAVFGEFIGPDDFGYDIYAIMTSTVRDEKVRIELVTKNGFAKLGDDVGVQLGVRNMICTYPNGPEGNPTLLVGTAAYDGEQSQTVIVPLRTNPSY
jgi:hypothetical protein